MEFRRYYYHIYINFFCIYFLGELNSLEFGKFISTSNEFEKDVVEITNSDPVLFISDLEPVFIQK